MTSEAPLEGADAGRDGAALRRQRAGLALVKAGLLMVAAGFVALVALFGARTAVLTWIAWTAPGDNVFPEACITQAVRWAADGEPIYRPVDALPVAPMLYGPLTYYAPAWAAHAIGDTSTEGLRSVGRAWSLAAHLMVALLLAEMTATWRRRQGRHSILPRARGVASGAAAALLYLVFVPIPALTATVRCDLPFLLLNLLTVRVLMAWDEEEFVPAHGLVLLGGMILLSASVRQIVLGPPATIALWLLARGRWGRTLVFCLAVPAVGVVLLLAGDRLAGGSVIDNMVRAGAVEYRLWMIRERFEAIQSFLLLLLAPAAAWGLRGWVRGRFDALAIYPVASLPFALLLAGKKGASEAYYAETIMASIPGAVLFGEDVVRRTGAWWRGRGPERDLPAAAGLLAACVALGGAQLAMLATNNMLGIVRSTTGEDAARELELERRRYREAAGDGVTVLELRWTSLEMDVPFVSADLFQHDLIESAGQVSWEPVTRAIGAGEFPVLAVPAKVFMDEDLVPLREAILAACERDAILSEGLSDLSFWRPRASAGASAP